MNSPIDGRYRGPGAPPQSTEGAIGEIMATLRAHGREMKEVRRELKDIGTAVTEIKTQMTNLVTEKGCHETHAQLMVGVQELREQAREHTNSVAQDLKDRMDGRREVTGVHRTVPQLWQDIAGMSEPHRGLPEAFGDQPKKKRGARYWITLTAAILALGSAVFGTITYINDRLERDERMEQALIELQDRLPEASEQETTHGTKTSD